MVDSLSHTLAVIVSYIAIECAAIVTFGFVRGMHERRILTHKMGSMVRDPAVQRPGRFLIKFDIEFVQGLLERFVMMVGLYAGYPHILTLFGALKIATGLNQAEANNWDRNYFLTGNLLSVCLAMFATLIAAAVEPQIAHLLVRWSISS